MFFDDDGDDDIDVALFGVLLDEGYPEGGLWRGIIISALVILVLFAIWWYFGYPGLPFLKSVFTF